MIPVKLDTLRVLVSWTCNLKCAYCCNEIPEIREQIEEVRLSELAVADYPFVCITGGEPLLRHDLINAVCEKVQPEQTVILYTNGLLLGNEPLNPRVQYINVGLHHIPERSAILIRRIQALGLPQKIRYHAQDIYADRYAVLFPDGDVEFRFWHLDDCDRGNERRVVLIPEAVS